MDELLAHTEKAESICGITCMASAWVPVKSGVPQGIALDLLMFLIYINDIGVNISPYIQLFANDCVLHRSHVIRRLHPATA